MEFLEEGGDLLRRERARRGEHAHAELDPDGEEGDLLDPIGDAEALLAAMAVAKKAADEVEESLFFRTRPLMGRWTMEHAGVACDAYQSRAVGEEAIAFCVHFSLLQPVRFSTLLYGVPGALTCCRFWCSKMTFCFRLWMDSAAEGFPFSEEAMAAWREPVEFEQLVRLVTAPAAQARFASLRALQPCRPA